MRKGIKNSFYYVRVETREYKIGLHGRNWTRQLEYGDFRISSKHEIKDNFIYALIRAYWTSIGRELLINEDYHIPYWSWNTSDDICEYSPVASFQADVIKGRYPYEKRYDFYFRIYRP